jgi:hypothetical protein
MLLTSDIGSEHQRTELTADYADNTDLGDGLRARSGPFFGKGVPLLKARNNVITTCRNRRNKLPAGKVVCRALESPASAVRLRYGCETPIHDGV